MNSQWIRRWSPIIFALTFGGVSSALANNSSFSELGCQHVSQIERSFLSYHVNHQRPSKEIEKNTVEQFIKKLDASKIYLLNKDVSKIRREMNGIFKKTAKSNCTPIVNAQELLIKRVKERSKFVKSYLGKKFKFNPKTKINLDTKERKYANSSAEANKELRKYVQFQVSNYLATDMKIEEAKKNLVRKYDRIYRRVSNYKTSNLWSTYLDAFARSLDPHSSYLSREQLEDFQIQMGLSLEGIGATLSSQDGFTTIEQLIPGGAAGKSNKLTTKDKIIAVGQGDAGDLKNVVEMDLSDVVRLIRGPKGSKVRLRVLRKKGKESQRFTVTLVRDKISLEEEAAAIDFVEKKINGTTKKIGLLNLPSFYSDNTPKGRSAARDMKKLLKKARKEKADAIVLDLSTNGGGSLDDAVKIAGLFFRVGNVVKQSQRQSGRQELVLADIDREVDFSGPLVVLTSRISASASEIVAGTLQDYKRAVIVGGDHTFGKGSVQSVQPLKGGAYGAIKTTVGMFFTAGGNSTQHRGVPGDIEFPSIYKTDDIGEKTLDYSLPPKKIPPFLSAEAIVTSGENEWKIVNKKTIQKLKEKSKSRVAKNKEFDEIKADLKKSQKRGRVIVVGDLLKEREDLKQEKLEKGEDPEKPLTAEQKKKKYLERPDVIEAINVASDLIAETQNVAIKIGSKGSPKNDPAVGRKKAN